MSPAPKHSITGTNIFTIMSAMAGQYGAINLSQGFPDFPIDARLGELAFEAIQNGWNQYAPMAGLPQLREAISTDIASRYQLSVDPEHEITVTPGATYAICTVLTSILQPGDEVIILEPAYDSYIPNIEMCGAIVVPVALQAPAFTVDWDLMKDAISPATKAIIINTPHNPTGTIWSREDWDMLAGLVTGTGIYIVSDEVYEQLVFDGHKHYSVLEHPELRDRSFALYSFGKVLHNTGWKTGYCIAPPLLTAAFRRIHQFLCFSVNTPAQYAIAAYMNTGAHRDAGKLLQEKRDYFLNLMKETPFKIHQPAAATYFQLAGYDDISDLGDRPFAEWLTKEHGVAAIPVSAFYRNGKDDRLLRFCFAKRETTLDAAANKLKKLSQ